MARPPLVSASGRHYARNYARRAGPEAISGGSSPIYDTKRAWTLTHLWTHSTRPQVLAKPHRPPGFAQHTLDIISVDEKRDQRCWVHRTTELDKAPQAPAVETLALHVNRLAAFESAAGDCWFYRKGSLFAVRRRRSLVRTGSAHDSPKAIREHLDRIIARRRPNARPTQAMERPLPVRFASVSPASDESVDS